VSQETPAAAAASSIHERRRLKRWNFNVTVPVFDWVHQSIWSPEREAADDARRAERRAKRGPRAPRPFVLICSA
jgi:hypothetical protein